jgi:DNA-binding transcriptional LysR family regulator
MLPRLDHQLLRTFVAVAEAGNLSRAGERLRLAQPTVSLQMKRLEDALGCRLMERTSRVLKLTGEGETLLAYGRRILALCDEAVARISEPAMTGLVRLGTPEDFATAHLSGVLAAFARQHPHVALEVTTDLTLNLVERFAAGEFDLVLVKREPLGPERWCARLARGARLGAIRRRPGRIRRGRCRPATGRVPPSLRLSAPCHASVGSGWAPVAHRLHVDLARRCAGRGPGGARVTVLPKDMVPPDFLVVDGNGGMPDLSDTEIALMRAQTVSEPAARLAEHIVHSLERK